MKKNFNLKKVLEARNKEELVSLLLGYARKDDTLAADMRLRFADKDDDILERARQLIDSAIDKASDRSGFVTWQDADRAEEGAEKVLAMASECEEPVTAVQLYLLVLERMMEMYENTDADGFYSVDSAKNGLARVFKHLPEELPDADYEKLASLIAEHSRNSIYRGYGDHGFELLEPALPLCTNTTARKILEGRLDEIISTGQGSEYDAKYMAEKSQQLRYQILKKYDKKKTASAYMIENITNPEFRRTAIESAIKRNKLDEALQLCLDGEAADADHAGRVRDWRQYRCTVCEKQGNIDGQKEVTRLLACNGDFDYFLKYKALFTAKEWPAVLQKITDELKTNNRQEDVYIKILQHEHLDADLLAFCQKNPQSIEALYKTLVPNYHDEVSAIFTGLIKKSANSVNNRKAHL